MNVNGPGFPSIPSSALRSAEEARAAESLQRATDAPALARPAAPPSARPAAIAAPLRGATLWDTLTPEERAFFSDPAALDTITYHPGGRPTTSAPVPTGLRVNLEA